MATRKWPLLLHFPICIGTALSTCIAIPTFSIYLIFNKLVYAIASPAWLSLQISPQIAKKQLFRNYSKDLQFQTKKGIMMNANYSHLCLTEPYQGKKTAMPKSIQSGTEITKFTDLSAQRQIPKVAVRIKSQDLFQNQREVEIEHEDRIYRLQITQLNKLILTA